MRPSYLHRLVKGVDGFSVRIWAGQVIITFMSMFKIRLRNTPVDA